MQTAAELEDCTQIAEWIRTACRWEVLAPKPGNVHPGAAFEDLTAGDFLESADLIAPILADARHSGVGAAILSAVQATQAALGRNTNLGIILLLAPLAAVPLERRLEDGVAEVLSRTNVADAEFVYEAIRCAQPGGMGQVDEQDVAGTPTDTLVNVMRLAAPYDRIAAQYTDNYRDVLAFAVPQLQEWTDRVRDAAVAIVGLHLTLMAHLPDTLIARKCGTELAMESASRAQAVLDAGWPESADGTAACAEFDRWLRADGHRRNPGTTADLIAATLFAAQRDSGWHAD